MCKVDIFDLLEEDGMSKCYRKSPHGRAKSPSARGSWGSSPGENSPWMVRRIHEFQERRVQGLRDTVCKGLASQGIAYACVWSWDGPGALGEQFPGSDRVRNQTLGD